jgi:hypothetical protein
MQAVESLAGPPPAQVSRPSNAARAVDRRSCVIPVAFPEAGASASRSSSARSHFALFPVLALVLTACGAAPSPTPASAAPSLSYAVSAARTAQGYELRLGEPGGIPGDAVSVTVLDPGRLLVGVAGTWGKDAPDPSRGGLATVVNPPSRPDILELYWSGACADEVVISVERTADGVGISLDASRGSDADTCRPRGFVHLLVAMATAQPVPADRVEITER